MSESIETELAGRRGRVVVRVWPNPDARYVALLSHGYGEHTGRYEHVAARLVSDGAAVYAPDHLGHGRSEGEPALIENGEDLTADLHAVADLARSEHPGMAVVLLGHSMGGLIATRFAQQHAEELSALVLSGPVIGGNPAIEALAEMDPIPEIPIDPAILSRDSTVRDAYAADPLVYHGPFKAPTVRALIAGVAAVAAGPGFGDLPVLWIHGEEDMLVPLASTREALARLRGPATEERLYPGGLHESFNEINRDEVLDEVVAFLGRALQGS